MAEGIPSADQPTGAGLAAGAGHESGVTADSLLSDVDQLAGRPCADCGQEVSQPDALMGLAMGFRRRAVCFVCLAKRMEADPPRLREHLMGYFKVRDCFREAWARISARPE